MTTETRYSPMSRVFDPAPIDVQGASPVRPPTFYERLFEPEKRRHYEVMQKTQHVATEMAFIGRAATAVVLASAADRMEAVHRLL